MAPEKESCEGEGVPNSDQATVNEPGTVEGTRTPAGCASPVSSDDGQMPKVLQINHKNHSSLAGTMINGNFLNPKFSDVMIVCEGEAFPCHKIILATMSKRFDELIKLGATLTGMPQQIITMEGTDASIMRSLLEFIYMGATQVTTDEVEAFLQCGRNFKVKGLYTEGASKDNPASMDQSGNKCNDSTNPGIVAECLKAEMWMEGSKTPEGRRFPAFEDGSDDEDFRPRTEGAPLLNPMNTECFALSTELLRSYASQAQVQHPMKRPAFPVSTDTVPDHQDSKRSRRNEHSTYKLTKEEKEKNEEKMVQAIKMAQETNNVVRSATTYGVATSTLRGRLKKLGYNAPPKPVSNKAAAPTLPVNKDVPTPLETPAPTATV